MKTITVDNNEINGILKNDIIDLLNMTDNTKNDKNDDYKNRRFIIERMNMIKKQCDKIINRINEYDNRNKE